MTKADWLYVGCKLIGLGLGVSGALHLLYQLTVFVLKAVVATDTTFGIASYNLPMDWPSLAYSAGYILAGYALVRKTNACVRVLSADEPSL
jgi:hypothetical protein